MGERAQAARFLRMIPEAKEALSWDGLGGTEHFKPKVPLDLRSPGEERGFMGIYPNQFFSVSVLSLGVYVTLSETAKGGEVSPGPVSGANTALPNFLLGVDYINSVAPRQTSSVISARSPSLFAGHCSQVCSLPLEIAARI